MVGQKPMLRQIECRLQNGPFTKSGHILKKFVRVLDPLKKNQFDGPTTQMSIFVFFVSAGV